MTCRNGSHYECDKCDRKLDCDEYIAPLFKKYEAIRQSGKYNMVTESVDVMLEMKLNPRHKLDRDIYFNLIKNYSAYAKIWL